MFDEKLDTCNIMTRMLKYSVLGMGVGVSVFYVSENKLNMNAIIMIAVIASLIYSFLDSPLFIKEYYYHKM